MDNVLLLYGKTISLTLFFSVSIIIVIRFFAGNRSREVFYLLITVLLLAVRLILLDYSYVSFILLVALAFFAGNYHYVLRQAAHVTAWRIGNGTILLAVLLAGIFQLQAHEFFFLFKILIIVFFDLFQAFFLLKKFKIKIDFWLSLLWFGKIAYLVFSVYDILAEAYRWPVQTLTTWVCLPLALYLGYLSVFKQQHLFPRQAVKQGGVLGNIYSRTVKNEYVMLLQDKLIRTGLLATGVLHELKNIFFAVETSLDFALQQESPEVKDRCLKVIRESIDRGRGFTMGILSSIKLEEQEKEEINLAEVLSALVKIMQANHRGDGILFRCRVDKEPVLYAGKADLQQILLNITGNSVDALKKHQAEEKEISLQAWQDGNRIIIEILDNGPGVPGELVHRIFEPDLSGKAGTGLGLYLARMLVERNDGTLEWLPGTGGAHFRMIFSQSQN